MGIKANGKTISPSVEALADQAKSWFDIQIDTEMSIEDAILSLHSKPCISNLVIRDWSRNDFIPSKHNSFEPPLDLTMHKLLLSISEKYDIDYKPFALTRNAIDVYLSSTAIPIKSFSKYYLEYVKMLHKNNIKIFRYEDLARSPHSFALTLATYIGVDLVESLDKISGRSMVTGDTQAISHGRYSNSSQIELPKRRWHGLIRKIRIAQNQDLSEANLLTKHSGDIVHTESLCEYLRPRVSRMARKLTHNPTTNS